MTTEFNNIMVNWLKTRKKHIPKSTDLCLRPRDDAASRQDISTPFSILIEFEATEYSYSIRFIFEISRIYDSIFDSNDIPDSSHPNDTSINHSRSRCRIRTYGIVVSVISTTCCWYIVKKPTDTDTDRSIYKPPDKPTISFDRLALIYWSICTNVPAINQQM